MIPTSNKLNPQIWWPDSSPRSTIFEIPHFLFQALAMVMDGKEDDDE